MTSEEDSKSLLDKVFPGLTNIYLISKSPIHLISLKLTKK
jgi:hypothetical protein